MLTHIWISHLLSSNGIRIALTTVIPLLAIFMVSAMGEAGPYGQRYGILGMKAPALNLDTWIDAQGKSAPKNELGQYRGKVIYLYFFQDWCPGCHSHGFPTLQRLQREFREDERVILLAVQTAFEGKTINTIDKLRKNQQRYNLAIPMAHDGGSASGRGLPQTMINYRSGGTPWTVIIDPKGTVVYNHFHIQAARAIEMIKDLAASAKAAS